MNRMLNNFIVYGLSLLLLTASFHIESHHNDHSDGYSICNIDCDDEKHHSITHQCEKCLNKNNRLIVLECVELSLAHNISFYDRYMETQSLLDRGVDVIIHGGVADLSNEFSGIPVN